ncbi:MAG: S-methyl-5-thioribose-1-phosphate isomerase, partial [Synergistaceae bacterium]|nr:S-methyl-5-thioribose-1-phosphate isomerase [Synergistaceae bacterium]
MLPETVYFDDDTLNILDQRRLPGSVEYIPCTSVEETARAIESLA